MRYSFLMIFLVVAGVSFPIFAQDTKNPMDLSELRKKTKEEGISTTNGVVALENEARELFDAGKCKKAVPAIKNYVKAANALANRIALGNKPFYGASYDDRKEFSITSGLVKAERDANNLKRKRNAGFVMVGECLAKLGKTSEAVVYFSKALGLINIENQTLWNRARKGLYKIINYAN